MAVVVALQAQDQIPPPAFPKRAGRAVLPVGDRAAQEEGLVGIVAGVEVLAAVLPVRPDAQETPELVVAAAVVRRRPLA